MAEETGGTLYPVEALRAFTLRAFASAGVPDEDAQIVADNLIEANLRGVDTHGITRLLAIYVKRLKVGIVKARPNITIVSDNPSAIVVDGDNGLGAPGWRVAGLGLAGGDCPPARGTPQHG